MVAFIVAGSVVVAIIDVGGRCCCCFLWSLLAMLMDGQLCNPVILVADIHSANAVASLVPVAWWLSRPF